MKVVRSIQKALARRRAIEALNRMSDRQLEDIGIARWKIKSTVRSR